MQRDITLRVKDIRKHRKLSQQRLAEKSGVSLCSVKCFENTGEISLKSLIKIAIALEIDDKTSGLFAESPFLSIEEIINGQK